MRNKVCLALLGSALVFTSCNDRNNDDIIESVVSVVATERTVDASGNEWKYFSFTKGEEVQVTDPETSVDWDIAFMRYYVKTNSGVSGQGQGGVLVSGGTDFSALSTAPTTGYEVDDKSEIQQVGYPSVSMQVNYNSYITGGIKGSVLTGYVTYDPSKMQKDRNANPYDLTNRVYVVKTADGSKYVKIQFTDYRNAQGRGGHPKFIYQIAGSNNQF